VNTSSANRGGDDWIIALIQDFCASGAFARVPAVSARTTSSFLLEIDPDSVDVVMLHTNAD
jgi:hypothetical protein